MKRSYKIIPIYTADVSGVCSALYELGGMTVMHDPSGCNSTYNTHDEIRWYDQDSMIYISGLTEIDAVMGNDEKLIRDIEIAVQTPRRLNPQTGFRRENRRQKSAVCCRLFPNTPGTFQAAPA